MSDPQPAPLLWERRRDHIGYLMAAVLVLSVVVSFSVGMVLGSRIVPKAYTFQYPVTPATSAPATPAEVTP